jgi:multidrug transporter EmrE-like cation transporter
VILDLLLIIIVANLFAVAGNVVFKIGVNGFGKVSFDDFFTKEFYQEAFFTRYGWLIFASFWIGLAGRVLTMIPMSEEKFGIVLSLIAPIGLVLSVAAGYLVFHETYSVRELIGIIVAVIAVFILSGVEL